MTNEEALNIWNQAIRRFVNRQSDEMPKNVEELVHSLTKEYDMFLMLEVLAKQSPLPPKKEVIDHEGLEIVRCASCGQELEFGARCNYCVNCGQKIDWEVLNDL